MMGYAVYLLRCEDGSLYTGITTDPARRLIEHGGSPKGAKYTAVHRPVRMETAFFAPDRSAASKLEARIKKLTHAQKERLIAEKFPALEGQRLFRANLDETGGVIPMLLIGLNTCTSCKKACAFLDARGIKYEFRDMRSSPPTGEELRAWWTQSGLPIARLYNTSGRRYRELKIGEKRGAWTESEHFACLSSDGMLIRRPILVTGDRVLVGFKPEEWEAGL